MRKILPAISPCPPATCIPCSRKIIRTSCLPSTPSGTGGGHGRVEVLVRPEELEAHAFDPLPRGSPEQHVTREDVLDALVDELLQSDVELDDQAHRRSPGRLRRVLLVGFLRRRPVEVVTRHPRLFVHPHGPLAHADEPKTRRRHQRLLRAGDDDVDAPLIGSERTGPEPRDGVDDGDHVLRGTREALDVVYGTRRSLREHADGGLYTGIIRQRPGDLVVVGLYPPLVRELRDLEPERPAHLDPPAAEVTVVDDEDLVSRREEILDSTLESTRTARRKGKDVVLRQENPLQILVDPREYLAELRRAVVNNG